MKKAELPDLNSKYFYKDLFLISLGRLVEFQDNPEINLNDGPACDFSLHSMVRFKLDQLGFKVQTDQPSSDWQSYFGKKGSKLPKPSKDDLAYLEVCGLILNCRNVFNSDQYSLFFGHEIKDPKSIYGKEAKWLWDRVKEKDISSKAGSQSQSQAELDLV